jgi:bifunctional non-homologous end joining protein LigD
VKTRRTNDEVAAAPEAMWRSDLPAADAEIRLPGADGAASRNDFKSRVVSPWQPVTDDELAALDALGPRGTWNLQGHELSLTNLDKVLFPARGDQGPVTKRDFIRYHARVAPVMLPYLADRSVNLHRYPNGETECYAVVDSPAALVWMANYGAVELHPWTSRIPDVHRPTWAFIDIDPGLETTFDDVLTLARLFRTALGHLGVFGLPKVTGRRGVHIWIPLVARCTFSETRAWVEKVSRAVSATVPELVSWAWQKKERGGLARLDYTQNAINKTLVAPYSTRAAPGAPVSVPLEWDELDDPDLRPDRWTASTVLDRVAAVGDPFAQLLTHPQELPSL